MKTDTIKKIEDATLIVIVFLFPVFISSSFPNPFATPKLIILSFLLILVFLLKAIRNLVTAGHGLIFHTSVFDVPVFLLTVSYVISSFLSTPNRMEAFWLPGTASFVLGGSLLYFVVNQLGEGQKRLIKISLLMSASLVSFIVVLSGSGILKSFTNLPSYLRSETFTTVGSMISAAIFLIVVIPIALQLIIKNTNMTIKAVAGVSMALIGVAIVISFATVTKNWNDSSFPGLNNSWIVATESLKNKPLFGAGPGNYLSAFTRFIPLSYNNSQRWSLRFSNAQNFYLTTITETGLVGLASLVVLLFAVYKRGKGVVRESGQFEYAPLFLLLILFFIFPSSPVLFVLLFLLLALETKTHVVQLFSRSNAEGDRLEGKIANVAVSLPVIAISLYTGFLVVQATRGELIYQKAIDAVRAQDGKGAYDTIRDAITISPYADRYHITYAQLNLALANSISQKKNLTDEDKNTISQLVQQAIREGRAAVLLNSERASNWEVLGSIYKSVMPLAKGADQFAIQTYTQAVALDPVNPNTRISLGGIYFTLKRYEEAIDVFKLAALAKPDLPNSHYNLAIAYRDNSQYDKALVELQGALTLVPKDSKDYSVLQKEIQNVQSKYPKKTTPESGDTVKAPETETPAAIEPKVELPNDATPPSPTPTPTPALIK